MVRKFKKGLNLMIINKLRICLSKSLIDIINKINARWHGITYPKDITINGTIRIAKQRGCGKVTFGKNVTINSSWKANPSGGGQTHTLLSVGNGGSIIIGNNCGISNSTIVCQCSIVLEDNVNIGVNSVIYDTDMHSVEYEYRMKRPDKHIKAKSVIIKEGAWIGGHSIILKGVTIGRHSVVAAGSVVTKNIPDNELWGGNPAVKIRDIGRNLNVCKEASKSNSN